MPSFVGLTEIWLTDVVGSFSLPGYTLVSRRDRNDGRQRGGIILFARDSVVAQIVHIEDSIEYERSWHILHTDFEAICVGLWYRLPAHGEVGSIHSLVSEHEKYSSDCVGTLIVGDMNVHYKPWLKYSNGNSPEGRALFDTSCRLGFHKSVQKPTRREYLVDLVLTDVEALVKTSIVPKIADHNGVLSSVRAIVAASTARKRKVCQYSEAKWDLMKKQIQSIDWSSVLSTKSVEEQVAHFTDFLLDLVHEFHSNPLRMLHIRTMDRKS